jgi:ribonuclease HI
MGMPKHRGKQKQIRPFSMPGLHCFFDGCCEPKNPGGNMGMGALIYDHDRTLLRAHSWMIPAHDENSNNVAEYLAVKWVLDTLKMGGFQFRAIYIFGDSRLVIEQLWGNWRIKGIDSHKDQRPGFYARYAVEARETLKEFRNCRGFWIPRAENAEADKWSKQHLKEAGVEFRLQPEEAA